MKIRTYGNKNMDETTIVDFNVRSVKQQYHAVMATPKMFTNNSPEEQEQLVIDFRDTAEIDRMINLLQDVKKMATGEIDGYVLKRGGPND